MNDVMLRDMLKRVEALERAASMRSGVVTATSPLSVAVAGAPTAFTDCTALDGTTFAVDDPVLVSLGGPTSLVVLGRLV